MILSEKVWQEYHARLKTFIRGRVADDAASDDILQDVFVKMHSGLPSLKDASKLQSWLYQIARNAIVDYYRMQKPAVDLPDWLSTTKTEASEIARQELAQCLQPMIEQLPDIYRDAVVLSELKGMKQKEVSELQGTSLSGTKSRVQRGRALLREMLEDCCRLEFDHKGRLSDFERKNEKCGIC